MSELTELRNALRAFAAERDWDPFHSPKNLASALAVEAAELLEPFQWLTEEQSKHLDERQLAAVAEELADVQLYLICLADKLDIDLLQAMRRTIRQRSRLEHGQRDLRRQSQPQARDFRFHHRGRGVHRLRLGALVAAEPRLLAHQDQRLLRGRGAQRLARRLPQHRGAGVLRSDRARRAGLALDRQLANDLRSHHRHRHHYRQLRGKWRRCGRAVHRAAGISRAAHLHAERQLSDRQRHRLAAQSAGGRLHGAVR
jgi:dCTP diphosphatase